MATTFKNSPTVISLKFISNNGDSEPYCQVRFILDLYKAKDFIDMAKYCYEFVCSYARYSGYLCFEEWGYYQEVPFSWQ